MQCDELKILYTCHAFGVWLKASGAEKYELPFQSNSRANPTLLHAGRLVGDAAHTRINWDNEKRVRGNALQRWIVINLLPFSGVR